MSLDENGYDKYLEFQFGWSGDFYLLLFRAIGQADESNLAKLAAGFPKEVEAYKTFTRIGLEAFLARCTPGHPLIRDIANGRAIL